MAFSHGHVSDARCTGSSRDKSRSLFAAPAYSLSACPSGRCCALLCAAESRVCVGGEKGERRIRSLRFSARLKCTRPTRFHAGFRRFRKSCIPDFDSASSMPNAASSSCHSRRGPPRSNTPRQSWAARPKPAGPTPRPAGREHAPSAAPHRYLDVCRGPSRTMRRTLSSRRRPEEAPCRPQRPRVGEDRGPARARKPSAAVQQPWRREAARRGLRLTRGGREETGLGQGRRNPFRESTSLPRNACSASRSPRQRRNPRAEVPEQLPTDLS